MKRRHLLTAAPACGFAGLVAGVGPAVARDAATAAPKAAGMTEVDAEDTLETTNFLEKSLKSLLASRCIYPVGAVIAVQKEYFRYKVLPAISTEGGLDGWHLKTAGGYQLRAIAGPEGLDLRALGAACDGTKDDSRAFRLFVETDQTVMRVQGRPVLTEHIIRARSTTIRGNGLQDSVILMSGAGRLDFDGGDGALQYEMRHFHFEGVSIRAVGMMPEYLVRISYNGGIGGTSKSVTVRDFEFIGATKEDGFAVGLHLHNCRSVVLNGVRFHGARSGSISGTGLKVTGSPDAAPVEFFIDAVECYFLERAFDFTGWVEGIYMSRCAGIACHYGVTGVATPLGRPLIYIDNCHWNVDKFGVLLAGFVQFRLSGGSYYGSLVDGSLLDSFVAVQIDPSGANLNGKIEGIDVQVNSPFTQKIGIFIGNQENAEENVIIGANTLSNLQVGILLNVGTNGVLVRDDNRFVGVDEPIRDLGIGNINEIGTYDQVGWQKDYGSGFQTRGGEAEVLLNAFGEAEIPFVKPFLGQFLSGTVNNADPSTHGEKVFNINGGTTTGLNLSVRPNPGAVSVRVSWTAFGR